MLCLLTISLSIYRYITTSCPWANYAAEFCGPALAVND